MTVQPCEDLGQTGARIRELRLAQRLTQEQLASKAGIVAKTVQSIEAGRLTPRNKTRQAIATALGVTIDDLEAAS